MVKSLASTGLWRFRRCCDPNLACSRCSDRYGCCDGILMCDSLTMSRLDHVKRFHLLMASLEERLGGAIR